MRTCTAAPVARRDRRGKSGAIHVRRRHRRCHQQVAGSAWPSEPTCAKLGVDGQFQSAPTLFREGKYAEAERQFAWIAQVRPGTTWGERSQYYLAECQYQQKKYLDALESLERLHLDYPATDYCDQLVRREYEIAQHWITWSKPAMLTGKKAVLRPDVHDAPRPANTEKLALRALEDVRRQQPHSQLAEEASIKVAEYYMARGDFDSAAAYYDQFIVEYRKSPLCPRARLGAGRGPTPDLPRTPPRHARRDGGPNARQVVRDLVCPLATVFDTIRSFIAIDVRAKPVRVTPIPDEPCRRPFSRRERLLAPGRRLVDVRDDKFAILLLNEHADFGHRSSTRPWKDRVSFQFCNHGSNECGYDVRPALSARRKSARRILIAELLNDCLGRRISDHFQAVLMR